MQFLQQYGLFAAETLTLLLAVIGLLVFIAKLADRNKRDSGHIEIKKINEKYDFYRQALQLMTLPKDIAKKQRKAEKKLKKSAKKDHEVDKKRVFVLDFDGDIRASEVECLREEITAILTGATEQDEVVVRLESGGGMVHAYGLGASQLARIRQRGIALTIIVDKVAASGGYLMACVANRILAAPFAIVGSIGVIAQLPNFSRLLKKHDIDFEQITAGEYKRTITLFGENTPKAREKFKEEIEEIHLLFKNFITQYRPQVDLKKAATGESWPASLAKEMALVDELLTSDDYLLQKSQDHDLFEVSYQIKKSLGDRFSAFAHQNVQGLLSLWRGPQL